MQALNGLENIMFFKHYWFDNSFYMDTVNSTVSWDSDSNMGRPHPRITKINVQYLLEQAVIKLKQFLWVIHFKSNISRVITCSNFLGLCF